MQNITFEKSFEAVKALVNDFQSNLKYYTSKEYSEAQVRKDFIDKFFIALGWDVNHEHQKNPYEQEVKIERTMQIGDNPKYADYAFCLEPDFRTPRFLVEAKKPSHDLYNKDYYFQSIRYAWNNQTPLVILTDFEEFHIIDSRYKPDVDTALQRKIKQYRFTDYSNEETFRYIFHLFSREDVTKDSIFKYSETLAKPKGKGFQKTLFDTSGIQQLDETFLNDLDEFRKTLATSFKRSNTTLNSYELTEAVQRTLDRLIFIRFLEDKQIENEHYVSELGDKTTAWHDFINVSKKLDAKYNGIVFKEHLIDGKNKIFNPPNDTEFANICNDISHKNSPYLFNQIPVHILGSIYERFLGKVVVPKGRGIAVEEKPEVRKAGGVYYTPQYIVEYIVNNSVGKIIEGKTPKEISKLRFADIACGSGSFLITVFDTLLKYHGKYYNENITEAKKDGCIFYQDRYVLSLKQKKEILENNIYGVDIDSQAVEVTQVSLFLKLLEDETPATASETWNMFQKKETLLPSLDKNIICGNSLIGSEIYDGQLFSGEEERKINPMDFEVAFPQIMRNGGFDCIVGNPPYINIQFVDDDYKNYLKKYNVYAGKADLLYFFFEKAVIISNKIGLIGLITSRYYLEATDAKPLRNFLVENSHIEEITDFKNYSVFKGVGIHTVINIISKTKIKSTRVRYLISLENEPLTNDSNFEIFDVKLKGTNWILSNNKDTLILNKISLASTNLGAISTIEQGQKTGLNEVFGIDLNLAKNLEKKPLKKLIKNSHINRYTVDYKNVYLIYANSEFEINDYPKIKEYLSMHKKALKNRAEAKDDKYPWYRLQRSRDSNLFDSKEKIVVPYRAEYNKFAYDDQQYYNDGGDIRIIVIDKSSKYDTKFILGILNSKLMNYYYKFIGRRKGKMLEYFVDSLSKIPIKKLDFKNDSDLFLQESVKDLVTQIINLKNKKNESLSDSDKNRIENRIKSLDYQIDQLVYKLYDLTPEEIKIVEGE